MSKVEKLKILKAKQSKLRKLRSGITYNMRNTDRWSSFYCDLVDAYESIQRWLKANNKGIKKFS